MTKLTIPTSTVVLLRLITAATAVSDGYDLGVVNGVSMLLSARYEPATISFFVSIMPACVGVGALLGAFAADRFGRKPTLIFSYGLLIAGAVMMGVPGPFELLMTGRAIVGLGIGIGGVVGTVYMAELAPTKNRGSWVAQEALFLSCGLLLGYLANYLLMSLEHNYNVMLGLGAVLPFFCLVALLTVGRNLPESPHWQQMDAEGSSQLLVGDDASAEPLTAGQSVWETSKEFFSTKNSKLALMVGILQPLCGVGPILYFSDLTFSTLEAAGKADGAVVESPPLIAMSSIYIGLTKVAVLMVSTLILMDTVGRRTMLLVSSSLMVLALGGITSVLHWAPTETKLLLGGFCCAIAAYAIGWNCVPTVYPSEVLPTRVRTFGMSFTTLIGRVVSVVNAFMYPLFGLKNPALWFLVFACINVVTLGLVFAFVKETLHKPLVVKRAKDPEAESEREELIDHVDT